MRYDLYNQTVKDLEFAQDCVWERIHVARTLEEGNVPPPITVALPIELLLQLLDSSITRSLKYISDYMTYLEKKPRLSRSEAARVLKRSTRTLRRWEEEGILIPVYIGGKPFYAEEDLEETNFRFKNDNLV